MVKDAEYYYVTHTFQHEAALVYVRDNGKTRIGDYISAIKVNENATTFTHKLKEIVRTSGHVKCPITGQLIRDNQLVDTEDLEENVFDRQKILDMHDEYLGMSFLLSQDFLGNFAYFLPHFGEKLCKYE